MPWDRRGDFYRLVNDLRQEHDYSFEIKWNKVKTRFKQFYLDLVKAFFECRDLMFHCLIVCKANIDKEAHNGDYDLAFRKHYAMLLDNKIRCFAKGHPNKRYRIHTDPIASSYAKADEAARIILGHKLCAELGMDCIESLRTKDSKESLGIQICDLLLGAVMSSWQRKDVTDTSKIEVRASVANHLGWSDMHAVTFPKEWKFNIWYFENPNARDAPVRNVKLLVPMPERRKRLA